MTFLEIIVKITFVIGTIVIYNRLCKYKRTLMSILNPLFNFRRLKMNDAVAVEKKGVKDLSEAIVFAITLGEAVELGLQDGKLGLEDLGLLVVPFTKAPDAVEGISNIKDEIMDLDAAERGVLNQMIKDELDLADDKLEAKIEAGVDFLAAIHTFMQAIKA